MARLPGGPTVETLAIIFVVGTVQVLAGIANIGPMLFALAMPLTAQPWTLFTSVYAHGSVTHLVVNAIALAVVGPIVARRTTRVRLHLFFVGTGALSGLSTVLLGLFLGRPAAVLGASGAVLALVGYAIAGNWVTRGIIGRVSLDRRAGLVLALLLAGAVVVLTAGPRVALAAHATGFLLGLAAGRARLLRVAAG